MAINAGKYQELIAVCTAAQATLVAVSKTKPPGDIEELYRSGQRDFGENYVQELVDKYHLLAKDIHWHFIGHLQSNKVKYIAPFVYLIHGVDSQKLLRTISKEGLRIGRRIPCLLQVHIAQEESKFGFDPQELADCLAAMTADPGAYTGVLVRGLMGMASFSQDPALVGAEFQQLRHLFDDCGFNRNEHILSMGMSGDYPLALAHGSNLVRIGSLLFGARG